MFRSQWFDKKRILPEKVVTGAAVAFLAMVPVTFLKTLIDW
jgi:hypothetical protein